MAGRIVQIVPKTAYSISSGAGTVTLDIGPRVIPAQDWCSGVLLVNLFSVAGPSNTIRVNLLNAYIGPEDPSVRFTSVGSLATVTFTGLTGAPVALSQNFTGAIGGMVAARIVVTGGTSGIMDFTIAVEVEGREY